VYNPPVVLVLVPVVLFQRNGVLRDPAPGVGFPFSSSQADSARRPAARAARILVIRMDQLL
jgi:hypothetical protein